MKRARTVGTRKVHHAGDARKRFIPRPLGCRNVGARKRKVRCRVQVRERMELWSSTPKVCYARDEREHLIGNEVATLITRIIDARNLVPLCFIAGFSAQGILQRFMALASVSSPCSLHNSAITSATAVLKGNSHLHRPSRRQRGCFRRYTIHHRSGTNLPCNRETRRQRWGRSSRGRYSQSRTLHRSIQAYRYKNSCSTCCPRRFMSASRKR